jgi:dUTP pyrophosphatase
MKVQIVNKSDFELPAYATEGSAGMDLRADLKRYMLENNIGVVDGDDVDAPNEIVGEVMELKMIPHQQYVIPTGIFLALPKAGTAHINVSQDYGKHLLPVFGTQEFPFGYEVEVRPRSGLAAKYGVTVLNSPGTVDNDYRGEFKVILICHNPKGYTVKHGDRIAQMIFKQALDETERGTGGFGHTGK